VKGSRRASRPASTESAPSAATPAPGLAPDLRRRVLHAFTIHAFSEGLRGVVLAEIAAEVGTTLGTLRHHFPTKADLVRAVVESWVEAVQHTTEGRARRDLDSRELLRWWTDAWVTGLGRFSPGFWKELERDYPEAWAIYQATREQVYGVRARVRRGFRDGVRPDVAGELYELALAHFNDPEVCERLGITRREAVNAAVEVWMGGALAPPAAHARRRS
jgi:AcrR family transcriptional regulator